jgi:RNase P subunit RPR2
MICDRCLKELIAAFEFVERSRSAEKLYFVKLRDEVEVEKQTPEGTEETDDEEVGAQYEEEKIKREPSIDIEDVELEISDDSDEAIDVEESPQMFDVQVTTKSSSSFKEVPGSMNKKNKRTNPKPFQCPVCNKALSRSDALQHHIESVHKKRTRFTCPHCPKAFYYRIHLQNHIISHTFTKDDTKNANRPFECDTDNCGKFFKTKQQLIQHQVVHSGEFFFSKFLIFHLTKT